MKNMEGGVKPISRNKVKIDQYLVNGKRRDYCVLVLPKSKGSMMWAYYEKGFDERYEIDADTQCFKLVRYALAALIANPSKIIYFPIRGEGFAGGSTLIMMLLWSGPNCNCGVRNGRIYDDS